MSLLLVGGFFQLQGGEDSGNAGVFRGMRSLKTQGEDFWGRPASRVMTGKNTGQGVTRERR